MASGESAGGLCRICNANEPKYTCPRCQQRTCSLACYKRHQTWAQCSGKRNPAAYLKKSQWATPAGVDHDYNFLTGIEQAFDSAERDADGRGVSLTGRNARGTGFARAFERRLADCQVAVQRAPKGMSRQKSNQTRWHQKYKCIMWTVEWFHPDGQREVTGCLDNVPLVEAYYNLRSIQQPAKKRKLSIEEQSPRKSANQPLHLGENPCLDQPVTADDDEPARDGPQGGLETQPDQIANTALDGSDAQAAKPDGNDNTDPSTLALRTEGPPHVPPDRGQAIYFYLVKPHTSGPFTVVVPVSQAATLSACLNGQVVLEFPTIQVLEAAPNALPDGFLLEENYFATKRRESGRLVQELGPVAAGMHDERSGDAETAADAQEGGELVDPQKIMQVWRSDLDIVPQHTS